MEKYEDNIHNVTPTRLAELLEQHARVKEYYANALIKNNVKDKEGVLFKEYTFEIEVLREAANRLRERMRPAFNNEAFE